MFGVMAWPRHHRPDIDRRSWLPLWSTLWTGGGVSPSFPRVFGPTGIRRHPVDDLRWVTAVSGRHQPLVCRTHLPPHVGGRDGVGGSRVHHRVELALRPDTPTDVVGARYRVLAVLLGGGQQMGGILTPDTTDPSLGPMMVLLALVAWPRARHQADQQRADTRYRHVRDLAPSLVSSVAHH